MVFFRALWKRYCKFCNRPYVAYTLQTSFFLLLCLISKTRILQHNRELEKLDEQIRELELQEEKRKGGSGSNNSISILSEYETYSVSLYYTLIMVGCIISVFILLYVLKYKKYTAVSNNKLYTLSELRELLLANFNVPKGGNKYAIIAMFVSVFMLNLIGLFPFYYSTTATILIPVVISITVSLVYLFRRAKIYQEYFLTHLVPQTNSLFLSCFVYIVEATGLIIRAFSLGLRLTCNVLCGHLLISIISVFLFKCFMCTVSYTGYYHLNFYSFEQ